MSLPARDTATPDSPVGRWDARWKLAAVGLAVVAVAALRTPWPAAVAVLLAVAFVMLGRVAVRTLLSRASVVLLAVAPVLVVLPFTTEHGGTTATAIGLRALAVGTLVVGLVYTAPLARTFAAAHALYVPGVLVQVAQLAHRYALLFAAEVRRVRVAMLARGFRPSPAFHTYRTLGAAAGTLLIRGGDRAERVADAMRCRGFDGTYRPATPFLTGVWDVVGFVLMVAAFGVLVWWDRQCP
jgi:cobalt/nickel transport system permease protein